MSINAWEALKLRYRDEDIKLHRQSTGSAIISFPPHTKYDAYYVEASARTRALTLVKLAEKAELVIQRYAKMQEHE